MYHIYLELTVHEIVLASAFEPCVCTGMKAMVASPKVMPNTYIRDCNQATSTKNGPRKLRIAYARIADLQQRA